MLRTLCAHPKPIAASLSVRMYLADERFMATYEAIKPGLTVFLHDAIFANAVARS
jgi:hypothetical protein